MPAKHRVTGAEAPTTTSESKDGPCRVGSGQIQALIDGISRLVEGQRRFADEFGLSYERVFSDGFEAFKGRAVEDVLAEWLAAEHDTADSLTTLIRDLADHQMALLTAVEAVDATRTGHWQLPLPPRLRRGPSTDAMQPFVSAYARSRQTAPNTYNHQEGD